MADLAAGVVNAEALAAKARVAAAESFISVLLCCCGRQARDGRNNELFSWSPRATMQRSSAPAY